MKRAIGFSKIPSSYFDFPLPYSTLFLSVQCVTVVIDIFLVILDPGKERLVRHRFSEEEWGLVNY
jgi:hypothetical protein